MYYTIQMFSIITVSNGSLFISYSMAHLDIRAWL